MKKGTKNKKLTSEEMRIRALKMLSDAKELAIQEKVNMELTLGRLVIRCIKNEMTERQLINEATRIIGVSKESIPLETQQLKIESELSREEENSK